MTVKIIHGPKDELVKKIFEALQKYDKANPNAQIDLYRQNSVSVRIRIVDPAFHGLDKSGRHEKVWRFLEQLPDEIQSDISMLVLLAPSETKTSFANLEFDDPVPSHL